MKPSILSTARRSFLTLTASTLLAVSYTHAAVLTWDPDGDPAAVNPANGTWSTAAGNLFWNNGGLVANVAWASANEAVFGGSGGPYAITSSTLSAQKITFASSTYTLSGTSNVTITPISGNPILQVDSGAVATIGSGVNIIVGTSAILGQATGSTAAGTLNIDAANAVIRPSTNTPGWSLSGNGFIVNVKNGTLRTSTTANGNSISVGTSSGSDVNLNVSGTGVVTVTSTGGLIVGGAGKGTATQTGGTINMASTSTAGVTLGNGVSTTDNTFNLNGGVLNTPVIRKGTGTGNNVFNFNGGLVVANNTAASATFMEGLSAANVKAGGARIQNAQNITINQALLAGSPSGGLTKTGAGTLTLGGANTYTGDTAVSAGTLKLSTAGSSSSNVVVAASASTGALVAATDGQHINTGNLTLDPSSKLVIDYGTTVASTVNAPLKVANFTVGTGCTLELVGTEILNVVPGQNYPLVNWTGTGPLDGTNFAPLILTNGFSVNLSVVSNTLIATFTAPPPISWNTGNGTWDTSTPNWVDQANLATTFTNLQKQVLFGDAPSAGDNPVVTLDSVLSPLGVTMDSGSRNYTISGTGGIAGPAGITLASGNTGTLTLATANTYTGPTGVIGGTLSLGDGGTSGSLATGSTISVSSGATFAVKQSDTVAQGTDFGLITGAGGFVQNGGGTATLNSLNTFTGPISVTNGALQIGATGRLGGGTYAGDISITAGASFFQYGGTNTQTLSGIISGPGSLVKASGSGTLTLSGANTYQGSTTVNGGTLNLGTVAALGSTSAISMADGAILRPAIAGVIINAPIALGGIGTTSQINAPFTTSAGGTVETLTLNNPITGDGNLRLFSSTVSFNTNATIVLNAQSTYSGNTELNTDGEALHLAGVNLFVKLGVANALPPATVLTLDGNVGRGSGRTVSLDLNGFNQELAGLAAVTTRVARNQRVTNTSLTSATLTINSTSDSAYGGAGPSSTFSGNPVNPTAKIVGNLALTKTGAAKFTLLGSHDYTGSTTVTQGTLSQSAPNTSNETSTVAIAASGAFLELNFDETGGPVTDTVDKLFIDGIQQNAGVYKATDNVTDSGTPIAQITGAGTLTVSSNPLAGYAAWASTNAGGETADLDFDKDGVSNGVEYFMNAPAGFTANPQLSTTDPRTITWTNGGNIPASAYGTQFVIQTSSNLSTWTDVPVGSLTTNTNGPGGSLTYTLTGASPQFIRLKVTPN